MRTSGVTATTDSASVAPTVHGAAVVYDLADFWAAEVEEGEVDYGDHRRR